MPTKIQRKIIQQSTQNCRILGSQRPPKQHINNICIKDRFLHRLWRTREAQDSQLGGHAGLLCPTFVILFHVFFVPSNRWKIRWLKNYISLPISSIFGQSDVNSGPFWDPKWAPGNHSLVISGSKVVFEFWSRFCFFLEKIQKHKKQRSGFRHIKCVLW